MLPVIGVVAGVCLILCWPQSQSSAEPQALRPSALAALEEARRAIVGSRIEWYGLPEGREEHKMRYVSRFASNGDMLFENRGDPQGWTAFTDDLNYVGVLKYPHIYLHNTDGVWLRLENRSGASWWKPDPQSEHPWVDDVLDPRFAGATPFRTSLRADLGFNELVGSAGPAASLRGIRSVGDGRRVHRAWLHGNGRHVHLDHQRRQRLER